MLSRQVMNIVLISCAVLSGGVSTSLLSSFYPMISLAKDVSELCSGVVLVSVLVTTVIFTLLAGKYVMVLGTKNTLICGFINVALGNISFGFLTHIQNKNIFTIISFLICVLIFMGVSAIGISSVSIAEKHISQAHTGKAVSVILSLFGIGTLLGPSLGGVLYYHEGFSLTFWIIGGLMILLSVILVFYLVQDDTEHQDDLIYVSWYGIFKYPCIMANLFALSFASMGCSWYSNTLDQFLLTKYNLPSSQTGLIFKLFTLCYSIFAPIFGVIADSCKMECLSLMIAGNTIICCTAGLLGPVPQLSFLGGYLWLTVISVGVQGVGCAASYTGALLHLLRGIQGGNLPNNDQTRGMVTSIWIVGICSGTYLGSSLGGLAFHKLGFEAGCVRETVGLGVSVITIIVSLLFQRCCRRRISSHVLEQPDEEKGLLQERKASI